MKSPVFMPLPSSPYPRLPQLPQPVDTHSPSGRCPALDISPHQNTSLHQYDHDVVRELSLPPTSYPSAPLPPHSPKYNGSLPHSSAHFLTSPHHVSLDSFDSRPRTNPVPATPHNLIAQHGLPSSLPPPPRTTFYTQQQGPAKDSDPDVSNIASYFDSLLRGSYSQMLAQKPERIVPDSTAEPQRPAAELELSLDDMVQREYLEASFEEYLTSPLMPPDDSPEETPFLATPGEEEWTSPMVDAGDDSFGLGELPLFGAVVKPTDTKSAPEDDSLDVLGLLNLYPAAEPNPDKMDAVTPALDPLDATSLYTMPQTPVLPPASLYSSPNLATNPHLSNYSSSSSATPPRRTKALPTGTRRNITPSELVPIDAPTQPRQYLTPSATSRKAIPAAFKGKKRALSEVDCGDDLVDPNAIEAKRRQNTLAARRSRQRKLEHVRELEETVDRLTVDRDLWMKRAYDAEAKLRSHGIA